MNLLSELLAPLLDVIARTGKTGGAISIVLGVGCFVAGLYLTFGLIEDAIWPIMLTVSAVGVVLIALGLSAFFGTQARLASILADAEAMPEADPATIERARELAPPFWVCSECRIVEPGVSITARCTRCAHVANFVQVESEAERATAVACLS